MILNKLIVLFFLLLGFSRFSVANDTLAIGLNKAAVRQKPNMLARSLGFLKYGDTVPIKTQQGPWYQIDFNGAPGWLHQSAFAKADYVLKDLGKGGEISKNTYKDEAVAAGKGFSPEYEAFYKEQNPEANFSAVDSLEKREVDGEAVMRFAEQGQLHGQFEEPSAEAKP